VSPDPRKEADLPDEQQPQEEPVEAEVVEEGQAGQGEGEEPAVPGELVRTPDVGAVIRPLDLAQTREAMQQYQQGLASLLTAEDYQNAGGGRRFVKKSGWRKIATWFGLSVELRKDDVERDEEGNVTRATVWARAVAPNGRFADADGHCDVNEERFKDARGRQKLENDLRATAATRAINRAISNLVGMGAVSAEEMDGSVELNIPKASKALTQTVKGALAFLFEKEEVQKDTLKKLEELGEGTLLRPVAQATVVVASQIKKADTEEATPDGGADEERK
jgi:hypothetical protein